MAGSGRPGDRTFFIYDHSVVQREEDDPKDAIVYFYPHSISTDTKCLFCGQLMGMVNLMKMLGDSMPRLYRLKKLKIATKHEGNFTLALAGKVKTPDAAVKEKLNHVYSVFAFYHGSLQKVLLESKNERETYLKTMDAIWDCYLPFIRRYGNTVPAMFEPIPRVQLPKSASLLYLRCSHILQWLRSKTRLLGGCILYKNSVLCTQLTPELTSHLLLIRPNQSHLPSKMVTASYSLPFGVRIMSVYLTKAEYRLFAKQTKTSPNCTTNTARQEASSVNGINKPGYHGSNESGVNSTNTLQTEVQYKSRDSLSLQSVVESRAEDCATKDIHISQSQDLASTKETHVPGSHDLAPTINEELDHSNPTLEDGNVSDGKGVTEQKFEADNTDPDDEVKEAPSHTADGLTTADVGKNFVDNSHGATHKHLPNSRTNDPDQSRTKDTLAGDNQTMDSATISDEQSSMNESLIPYQTDDAELGAGEEPVLGDGDIKNLGSENQIDEDPHLKTVPSHCSASVNAADTKTDESCSENTHDGGGDCLLDNLACNLPKETSRVADSGSACLEERAGVTGCEEAMVNSHALLVDGSGDGHFVNHMNSDPSEESTEVDRSIVNYSDANKSTENPTENVVQSDAMLGNNNEVNCEIQTEDVDPSNAHPSEGGDVSVPDIGQLELPDATVISSATSESNITWNSGAETSNSIGDLQTDHPQERHLSDDAAGTVSDGNPVKKEDYQLSDKTCVDNVRTASKNMDIEKKSIANVSDEARMEKDRATPTEHTEAARDIENMSVHPEAGKGTAFVPEPTEVEEKATAFESKESETLTKTREEHDTKTTEGQDTDVDEVAGMINVSLYVQAHSDMVLLYLADNSFIEDKAALFQVWRSVLTELGELEPKLKQCVQHRTMPDSVYNFIQYDNFDRLLQSSLDNPVTPIQNEFCRAAHMLHHQFSKDESVTDITVRNHRGAVYAHQNVSHQTYVQNRRGPATITGIPTRDDHAFFLDTSAQKLLYRDHSINIL